jgi:hypothetical protein
VKISSLLRNRVTILLSFTVTILLCGLILPSAAFGANSTDAKLDHQRLPLVSFSSPTYSVEENAGFATVTVNLSVASTKTVTVHHTAEGSKSKIGIH